MREIPLPHRTRALTRSLTHVRVYRHPHSRAASPRSRHPYAYDARSTWNTTVRAYITDLRDCKSRLGCGLIRSVVLDRPAHINRRST